MNKKSVSSCLGCSCFMLLTLSCCIIGGISFTAYQQATLSDAAKLYDEGRHDEAVEKYKQAFGSAGTEKAPILKRIVEHELKKGNTEEAKRWVERGVNENLSPPYENQIAINLHETLIREHAERLAQRKNDQEEKARQRQEASKGTVVTAAQLRQDFQFNATTANGKFKGKTLRITGTLAEVVQEGGEIFKDVIVVLDGNAIPCVQCHFPRSMTAKLTAIQPGQQITVRGRCDGYFAAVGEIRISGCHLDP